MRQSVSVVVGVVVAVGMGWASTAAAGQLSIQEHSLKDVLGQDAVAEGKVLARRQGKRSVELQLEVRRIWSTPSADRSRLKIGQQAWIVVYAGVEWTDPHKSPIEARLVGAARDAAVGDVVIAVPALGGHGDEYELLPSDAPTQRTLEVLTAKDPVAEIAKLDVPTLEGLLGSRDLGGLAEAELQKRGKLGTRALLGADERNLAAHWQKLDAGGKKRFIAEALPLVRSDEKLRTKFHPLCTNELQPGWAAAVAPFVALYSWERPDELRTLIDFHTDLVSLEARTGKQPVDLSPFADYLLQYELHRPDYRSTDDDLPKLTARMDAAAKQKLVVGFLRGAYTSSRATSNRDGDPDGFLLGEAERLATEAPALALLEPLRAIDPTKPRVTSTKEWVMETIVKIAVAVGKTGPKGRDAARDLVDDWFDKGAVASDEVRDLAQKQLGGKVQAPAPAILELAPGQSRRLPSGQRIRFAKLADGTFELKIDSGDTMRAWSFAPAPKTSMDWFRELYLQPYYIETRGVGDKLNLHLTPRAEPKAAEQAELMAQAEKIAKRRGCGQYLKDDYNEDDGRFEYWSEGPGGKKCSLLIGVRTRRVVRMTP